MAKLKLAIFKFASCDGCQLSLLDAEADLLALANTVEIAHFLEATSRIEPGPYDVALVEGSVTTPDDRERIQRVRESSKLLITIGACATSGGIQSLRNWADHDDFVKAVYAKPEFISTLSTSTAIADHVKVDFELRGCPVNQRQLVEVIRSLVNGRQPRTPTHSVCLECKRRGVVCMVVSQQKPCLGPITQAGCGAVCPTFDRGCYGCFGPNHQANVSSLADTLVHIGWSDEQMLHGLRAFNANSAEFQAPGAALERRIQAAGEQQDERAKPEQQPEESP